MAQQANTFLYLAECKGEKDWGKPHLVEDNKEVHRTHNDKIAPASTKQLLPVLSGGYAIIRGDGARPITIPVNLSLATKYLPVVEMIQNFTGAEGVENRINAKVLSFFDNPFTEEQIFHHNRTLTLFNGYIQSVSYSYSSSVAEGTQAVGTDSFNISLVATEWKVEYYMPKKKEPVDISVWSSITDEDDFMSQR